MFILSYEHEEIYAWEILCSFFVRREVQIILFNKQLIISRNNKNELNNDSSSRLSFDAN